MSLVVVIEAFRSMCWTSFMSTPAASASVAAP
jgi:hypothetical protein